MSCLLNPSSLNSCASAFQCAACPYAIKPTPPPSGPPRQVRSGSPTNRRTSGQEHAQKPKELPQHRPPKQKPIKPPSGEEKDSKGGIIIGGAIAAGLLAAVFGGGDRQGTAPPRTHAGTNATPSNRIIHNPVTNGYGTYVYSNGYYQGYFRNGKRHGHGKYTWANGNVYEGDYQNGKRTGQGIFYYRNGDIYNGGFENNLKHGQGTYFWKDTKYFQGTFVSDYGISGHIRYQSGLMYRGSIDKNGRGSYIWPSGISYNSNFQNGIPLEEGFVKTPEGKIWDNQGKGYRLPPFSGDDGLYRISGRYALEAGEAPSQSFTFVISNTNGAAAIFSGEDLEKGYNFENVPLGRGILNLGNGTIFYGIWSEKGTEFEGTVTWKTRHRYEGAWLISKNWWLFPGLNSAPHGNGTLYTPQDIPLEGNWDKGCYNEDFWDWATDFLPSDACDFTPENQGRQP